MPKIITDKNKIAEVLDRGVEKIYPGRGELEKALASGRRLKLYCGFDPSAPSLHIGNAIQLNKLSQFQALGHHVIFLIGDFTGMIGDPTDKTAARKQLTRAEVLANSANYRKQASAYLRFDGDNPAEVLYNSQWNDKLSPTEFINLASNFTAQQIFHRHMFQERLKENKEIYLHEFLYPLVQAYDSVAMDVDLEVGGNDQMFNMMCGRDLMKALKNKEKFVMTTKLLADPAGKKMGKTEGNAVNLNETPDNVYGQIMSWPDGVIGLAFELCTKVPADEVRNIHKQLGGNKTNPRDLKMRLAFEMTQLIHGEAAAKNAESGFIKQFRKKETPEEVETHSAKNAASNIVELLCEAGLAASKGEARRLIAQKGIKVDGEVVDDINKEIRIAKNGVLIQRGKRQFVRVVI